MKSLKYLTISFVLILGISTPLFAQTASPSAELDKEMVKEKLKERLEKTLSENPIQKRVRWYGLFGTITSKTGEDTFSITKKDSTTATVVINADTTLNFFKSGAPTRKVKVSDIQQDWFAIAMGTEMSDNQTLTASRITFSAPLAPMPKRISIFGKVTEIDDTNITLVNGKTNTITIPKKYNLQVKGVSKPALEDVNINDKAVAVVEDLTDGDKTVQTLKALYIIPSSNNPKAAGNQIKEATGAGQATPSATLKPGASAKPSATPKTTAKATSKPSPKPTAKP